MKHHILYGKTKIEFEVKYSERKTLLINVRPDKSVETVAPLETPLIDIEQKIEKRARWIVQQQRFFDAFSPHTPPRQYVSGETHKYLGKHYLLKIRQGEFERVFMRSGKIMVMVHDLDNQKKIKKMVLNWYRNHAARWFNQILKECYPLFKKHDIVYPTIELKRMTHRWGSCLADGRIVLHPDIVRASVGCIRYVIIHELCHLVIPHHNKDFFNLLSKKLPDWRKWKEDLDKWLV